MRMFNSRNSRSSVLQPGYNHSYYLLEWITLAQSFSLLEPLSLLPSLWLNKEQFYVIYRIWCKDITTIDINLNQMLACLLLSSSVSSSNSSSAYILILGSFDLGTSWDILSLICSLSTWLSLGNKLFEVERNHYSIIFIYKVDGLILPYLM